MSPEDLLERLKRWPFEPFRIHLTDGTTYEIRHPELILVGRRSLVVGVSDVEQKPLVYDRFETVALVHVVRLEPLSATA